VELLILTIEFPPGPGGIGTLSYELAKNLSKSGWNVSVSSPQNFSDNSEIRAFNNAQTFIIQRLNYKGPFVFEAINRFVSAITLLLQQQSNIIISIGGQATWLGVLLALLTNKPLVAIGIGTEFTYGNKLQQWITRKSFNRANKVIAISNYTQKLMKEININPSKISVIHCGADGNSFTKNLPVDHLKKKLNLEQSKVILTVGALSKRKAQDIVIRAIPKIKRRFPDIKYLVIGNPKLQTEFQKLTYELDVSDSVIFLGQVPRAELPNFYNLADLFVLVSRRTCTGDVEGFGIVVIEAALCGIPSIVSRNSGLEETVIDRKTGLIVDQENPEDTAEAIINLLSDDSLRIKMGNSAYQHAIKYSTWDLKITEYKKFLLPLIDF